MKDFRKARVLFALCLIVAGLAMIQPPRAGMADAGGRPVVVMTMDGAIGPAFSDYLADGLAEAKSARAQLVVIELDTPGGLLSSTRDMATAIVESPVPVAVWVTPSGAHAASAGTFILYAAHIAAMNEGTNVGAATPIEMRGEMRGQMGEVVEGKDARDKKAAPGDEEGELRRMLERMVDPNAKAMREKAIEDTAAFIRGLAELRGRNAEWAEKAVTEADSITAAEALEKKVIDLIAINLDELLSKIDGKTVTLKSGEKIKLATAGAPVTAYAPDWKVRFLSLITDPNVALILMSIGVYGLILEFYNPGTLVAGTVGAISLVLGLYAMNVLPVNAAGAILMLLGLVFMMAEIFIPSFGIMGFGGLAAFVTGAAFLFDLRDMHGIGINGSTLAAIGFFGALSIGLVVALTLKTYGRKVTTGTESLVGAPARVVEWKKDKGRVRIQGEIWHAESDGELDLKKNDTVVIAAIDELTLRIRAADSSGL